MIPQFKRISIQSPSKLDLVNFFTKYLFNMFIFVKAYVVKSRGTSFERFIPNPAIFPKPYIFPIPNYKLARRGKNDLYASEFQTRTENLPVLVLSQENNIFYIFISNNILPQPFNIIELPPPFT